MITTIQTFTLRLTICTFFHHNIHLRLGYIVGYSSGLGVLGLHLGPLQVRCSHAVVLSLAIITTLGRALMMQVRPKLASYSPSLLPGPALQSRPLHDTIVGLEAFQSKMTIEFPSILVFLVFLGLILLPTYLGS